MGSISRRSTGALLGTTGGHPDVGRRGHEQRHGSVHAQGHTEHFLKAKDWKGGRSGSDVLLGTTLSQSSLDLRHLRSPANLVLNEIRDTIPTAPRNTAVLCSQLYATALSIASRNASSMLILRDSWIDVQQGFQTAITSLAPGGPVFNQVRGLFHAFASDEQIEQAIDALRGHLNLFMQEVEVEGVMWTAARWLTDLQHVGMAGLGSEKKYCPADLTRQKT